MPSSPVPPALKPAARHAYTVLVAEDTDDVRESILRTLTRPDCRIVTAVNGREALELARANPPDVVISDVAMPEMDGFELLAALRDDPALAQTAVLMLTAETSRDAMRVGMTLGADDFLTKPFTPRELQDALDGLLRKRGRVAETVRHAVAEREEQLRRIYSRRLDGGFGDSIGELDAPLPPEMTLTALRASILYCDLRDFLGLAERLTPDEMSTLLREYFLRMEEAVLENGASHLRVSGSGLVALFAENGRALPPAAQAVRAAMAIVRARAMLANWIQHTFEGRGLPALSIGVGLHTGPVSLGTGRADDEPAIVGDAVRVASALELDARSAQWQVVASRDFLAEAGADVRTGWARQARAPSAPGGALEAVEVLSVAPDPERTVPFHPPPEEALEEIGDLAAWQGGRPAGQPRTPTRPGEPTLRIDREAMQRNIDATVRAVNSALESRLSSFLSHSFTKGSEAMRLAGYRLVRRIGSGGMSEVYLAEREDGSPLALKVMTTANQPPEAMTRFMREYALLAQLDHPNVVKIFNQGFSESHAYIAMEYFPRGDLRTRLAQPLGLRATLAVLRQIAGALEAVHARGIVHRDLKPENIMIRADDTVALADFGIAKPIGQANNFREVTMEGEMLGSPSYICPEQIAGRGVTPQADLYALGVMLFEMLAGRRPFVADNLLSLLSLHMRAEVPPLPASVAVFQPLVNRLMAKKPEDRYETATQLLADLSRI